MKLLYPAIFYKEENSYYVEFPDLIGCQSFGDTLDETYENSKEALAGFCLSLLAHDKPIPQPSPLDGIIIEFNSFSSYVETTITVEKLSV